MQMTYRLPRRLLAACALALAAALPVRSRADGVIDIPPPSGAAAAQSITPRAEVVFSGGCFWGVQGVFQHVRGVTAAVSGYAGGDAKTAEYEVVATGLTGHAESVRVTYDPRAVSFGQLMQIFFTVAHDPTEVNRQGPDRGSQYRSAIFATTAEQLAAAQAYVAQINASNRLPAPVATELRMLPAFYPAEGYHQNYLTENPDEPYIVINDLPKIAALKARFPALYREAPVLVPPAAEAARAQ